MSSKSSRFSIVRRRLAAGPRGEQLEARSLMAAGTFTFSEASYVVPDTVGVVWIDIERSGGSTGAVSVHLTAGPSSAPYSESATYGFAAGVTSQMVQFQIQPSSLAFLPNGTIPLALSNPTGGATLGNPSTSVVTIVHTSAPGNLNGLQGTNGFVADGSSADGYINGPSSLIGPDDSIYVFGAIDGHDGAGVPGIVGISVEKYHLDGTVDTSYGVNGVASISLPADQQFVFVETGMTFQPDGKLVIAGENSNVTLGGVVRFNTDGTPDTTFGDGGYASFGQPAFNYNAGTDYPSESVAVLKGGQIAVAGAGNSDLEPTVLNADGSLDTAFGTDGFSRIATSTQVDVKSVAAMPDGSLVLGGTIPKATSPSSEQMALWHVNLDGTLDTNFGQAGIALGPQWIGTGPLAIEPNGEILQLGSVNVDVYSGNYGILARYQPNGTLDTSFGVGGSTKLPEFPTSLTIGADGKIAIGESVYLPPVGSDPLWQNRFDLSLLSPNGSPVTSFGQSGTMDTPMRSGSDGDFLLNVAFFPGDEILANGVGTLENLNSSDNLPNKEEQSYYLGAPLTLHTVALTPVTGVPLNNVILGTFTDPGGAGGTDDYSATVNWGDGTAMSPATLVPDGSGGYTITGSHTYTADGTHTLTITLDNSVGVPSSAQIVVLAGGPATHLAVTSAPANATLGGSFNMVVTAEDAAGHADPNNSSVVSLALEGSTGATLGGTTTAMAVNGVATFTGLSLSKIGLGYSLVISAASLKGTTDAIGVTEPLDDFLGNGASQPTLFRRTNAGLAQWFVKGDPPLTGTGHAFGAGSLDVPLSGDFDGDSKADLLVYRPSTAQWFIQGSASGYTSQLLATFGEAGVDIPVPGNYSGSGIDSVAVYRPTTGQWFIKGDKNPITFTNYVPGDIPVPGDYDNVGKDELAIYRPSTGEWIIDAPTGVHMIHFGGPDDIPVPGSYDSTATNHAVEPAVWRPSTGQFFIHGTNGNRVFQFAIGDIPAPGDFQGIGETEATVYRPSTGQWYVIGPGDTAPQLFATYGGPTDIPVNAPYSYRKTLL